ncbi:MAG: hypothetical protein EZS28_031000 [Streblomastix strix]|uniref:Uncharacterized protein n=1 Tax=Streblomastix strix TaxID=222440 RepID=A0A5J4UTB1_9EUKA|nr:MAG: hypothetical protein EZS28_031000 [Streblomastix strix]
MLYIQRFGKMRCLSYWMRLKENFKAGCYSLCFNVILKLRSAMIVQMQVDLQSRMTSYDRIRFFSSNFSQEVKRSNINSIDPPQDQPESDRIQFDNVTFRY